MSLGSRIRAKRKAKGLTLQQLGDVFGISRSSVSEWESDRSAPANDKLVRLAEVLSTSVEELLSDSGGKQPVITQSKTHISSTLNPHHVAATDAPAGRLPVISWVQAGQWGEIVNNLRDEAIEEWVVCPFQGDFVLPVVGESMFNPGGDLSFRDGDRISVSTGVEPRHKGLVIAKRKNEASATFRQLLIENDGVLMLQTLNTSWPERYIKVDRDVEIIGVVTGQWRPL
ncbi:LexA family transcriptional regulator [Paraburkholderia sp. BL21I4N1]|uniref:LexA family protein n=1 Tax=Paraburkholderia sp. BL21I4N1 TaxID=1938801 RepID=UPI000CFDEE25|nr:XRE family transcriptional regulator [Paraburkholderia sp. BL21I4N1]PQV51847.1 phage repressor protein [Paraburkholderia sp. BL21I4N1]